MYRARMVVLLPREAVGKGRCRVGAFLFFIFLPHQPDILQFKQTNKKKPTSFQMTLRWDFLKRRLFFFQAVCLVTREHIYRCEPSGDFGKWKKRLFNLQPKEHLRIFHWITFTFVFAGTDKRFISMATQYSVLGHQCFILLNLLFELFLKLREVKVKLISPEHLLSCQTSGK